VWVATQLLAGIAWRSGENRYRVSRGFADGTWGRKARRLSPAYDPGKMNRLTVLEG